MSEVYHIRPGIWLIAGHGVVRGPVGLSYNKAHGCWTLSKKVFKEELCGRFYDRNYNYNPYNSYTAALMHIEEGRTLRKLETVERVCKERRLSACGVSYCRTSKGIHVFAVSNPLGGGTTVYVGTDETYSANLTRAFGRALDIRQGFEHEHAVKSYWSYKSCGVK